MSKLKETINKNENCSHVNETSIGDFCKVTKLPCFSQDKCISLDELLKMFDVEIKHKA